MTNAEEAIRFFERHLKEDVLKYGEQPAIHMAIAALRGQPNVVETDHVDRWISCADRLPKGHNPVLVCRVGVRGRVFVEVGYYAGDGRWRIQSTLAQNVPYWMPMPEAPAQLFSERDAGAGGLGAGFGDLCSFADAMGCSKPCRIGAGSGCPKLCGPGAGAGGQKSREPGASGGGTD